MTKWLALLAALVVMAAQAEPERRDALLGTWRIVRDATVDAARANVNTTMSFLPGGRFEGYVDKGGKREWTFKGSWVLAGRWLHYTYTESDRDYVRPGTKDRDEVILATSEKLVLKSKAGTETYLRVKQH